MLFNSYDFVVLFLPAVFGLYLISNGLRPRWNGLVLLAASIVFYGYWNPAYVPLLLGSIAVNFWIGRHVERRAVLWLGIAFNLGILFWYKYAFFVLGAVTSAELAEDVLGTIILPLGISFYTFQQISYLVDMRRGRVLRPDLATYGAYVALFPQLIAGPIVRYHDVDRQLQRMLRGIPRGRLLILASSGAALFSLGLFKKVVIADPLAFWADPVFAAAPGGTLSSADAWIGSLAYTFQLYFDFSAYSDMALGLGRMFGLFFPMNFYSPYKSRSIDEFWRRWHMSLSYFVRDYIYIPLGGSRRGPNRQAFNLFVAFTLIGIWHGAGYTFLLWGVFHGLLVIASHGLRRVGLPKMPAPLGIAATFFLVHLGWVMFRAADISTAMAVYRAMFSFAGGRPVFHEYGQSALGIGLIAGAAAIAFLAPNTLQLLGSRTHGLIHGLPLPIRRATVRPGLRRILLPAAVGVAAYFSLTSLGSLGSSFLYFNF